MAAIRALIDYMAGIIMDADAILVEGIKGRARLQPLRLRMAVTITSFQVALDSRLTALDQKGDVRASDLRRAAVEWASLANDYRTFTARNLAAELVDWNEYVISARAFMVRFEQQMRYVRTMLPVLDDLT